MAYRVSVHPNILNLSAETLFISFNRRPIERAMNIFFFEVLIVLVVSVQCGKDGFELVVAACPVISDLGVRERECLERIDLFPLVAEQMAVIKCGGSCPRLMTETGRENLLPLFLLQQKRLLPCSLPLQLHEL